MSDDLTIIKDELLAISERLGKLEANSDFMLSLYNQIHTKTVELHGTLLKVRELLLRLREKMG